MMYVSMDMSVWVDVVIIICVLAFQNVFKNAKETPTVKIKMRPVALSDTAVLNNYAMAKRQKEIIVTWIKNA